MKLMKLQRELHSALYFWHHLFHHLERHTKVHLQLNTSRLPLSCYLIQDAFLFQDSQCCCTVVSWAGCSLWGSVFTMVTSMNTIQWLKSRQSGGRTRVTQEDAISNYSGCDSSQTIFVLRTRCAALQQTNVRHAAPRRMTAVAFLDVIPNHTYDTIRSSGWNCVCVAVIVSNGFFPHNRLWCESSACDMRGMAGIQEDICFFRLLLWRKNQSVLDSNTQQ